MKGIDHNLLLDMIDSVKIDINREYNVFESDEFVIVKKCIFDALDKLGKEASEGN